MIVAEVIYNCLPVFYIVMEILSDHQRSTNGAEMLWRITGSSVGHFILKGRTERRSWNYIIR